MAALARWKDRARDAVRSGVAAVWSREPGAGRATRPTAPTARPVGPGVRIEYTPNVDGDPDPGEVVWTWVPFEEDAGLGKDRPVVIIGRHGDQLSGVALSTKRRDGHVEVGPGPWDQRNRTSYAKVSQLLDIDPDAVRREGAVLNRRRFDAVVEAVLRLHDAHR